MMRRMPAPPPELPGVSHRSVRVGDIDVHVAEAGTPGGIPIVLLHGWPQHWYCWRDVIPLLAADHHVLAPDLRGLGWTTPRGPYDKQTFAGDLLGLLDALGLERVHLVGHDWGGWTGFLACSRAPERFTAFLAVAICPPWLAPTGRGLLSTWRMSYQLVAGGPWGPAAHGAGRQPFLRTVLGTRFHSPLGAEEAEIYLERFRDPERARAGALYYRTFLARELPRAMRREQPRLRVPTRLLWGARDLAIHRHLLDHAHAHADDLRIEMFPEHGHWLPEEAPGIVAARAVELFSGVGRVVA